MPLPLETLPTPPLNSIRPLRYSLYLLTACLVQGRIFMTFSSSDPPPPKSHEFHRSTPSRNAYMHTDVDIDREREREDCGGDMNTPTNARAYTNIQASQMATCSMAKIVGLHYNVQCWTRICKVDLVSRPRPLAPFLLSKVDDSRAFGRRTCPDSNSLVYNKKCPFFVLFHSPKDKTVSKTLAHQRSLSQATAPDDPNPATPM